MKKYDFVVGEVTNNYPAVQIIAEKAKNVAEIWHGAYINACYSSSKEPKLVDRINGAAVQEADKECGMLLEAIGKAMQGKKLSIEEIDALEYYIEGVSFQGDPNGWINITDEE
jgi:hypothetical protein